MANATATEYDRDEHLTVAQIHNTLVGRGIDPSEFWGWLQGGDRYAMSREDLEAHVERFMFRV